MSQKAKVITKRGSKRPEGYEEIQEIHLGAKGKGRQIGPSVTCWPWSYRSMEEAEKIICEIVNRYDLELTN